MTSRRQPRSRFVLFILTLLLLIQFTVFVASTGSDEDEDIDELLAIDEQEEEEDTAHHHHHHQGEQQKEADVLTKAQRIVLELDTDSANKVISGNEYVLVLGYAPWDTRSAELMPQFAEAANKLKELASPVVMAKLDAERYPKAGSALQIRGFPTLLLFVNGSSHSYTGGFTGEDIVIWTRKKTGDPIIRVNSVSEAEKFLETHHIFVLGLFEKFQGSAYEEFMKTAVSDNEIQFVEVGDDVVAKVLFPDIKSTGNFIGLVKSEPEKYTAYEGDFEMGKIQEFLAYNKFPLVTRLTELNSVSVYSSPIKLQVMVFGGHDDFERLIETLQTVAKKFKSKIMFMYVDIEDENLAKPFLTLFGLEDSDGTLVTAFDNHISTKYLLESEPTSGHIEDFCLRLLDGSFPPYYKSKPVPDNLQKNTSVLAIVGKTFDDLVLSNSKNVLLEVFTPWCINCETTSKQVEKLAKHFKGSDNLVIARIDASANEHPKLEVTDFPTLMFYPADDKANPIKLSTKSSGKELAATINKHLKSQGTKDEL
ncbi:Protein disulfide isomerase-like 1-6 [Linum grandiflorum]